MLEVEENQEFNEWAEDKPMIKVKGENDIFGWEGAD